MNARSSGGLGRLVRRLLTVAEVRYPLDAYPAPVRELPSGGTLSVFLGRSDPRGPRLTASVAEDTEVAPGQALGALDGTPVAPSPVAGRVAGVRPSPDVRGGKPGLAVQLEPRNEAEPPFPPLDPLTVSPEAARERLRAAGVPLDVPRTPCAVVLAADPEPGLSSALRLLLDDPAAAVRAARLVGRLAGAERVVLAVLAAQADLVETALNGSGVEVLALPAEYPHSLPEAVARRVAPEGPAPPVVPLAVAEAARDAVARGAVPRERLVTVLGPDGAPVGNFRVPLGTRIGDVLAAAGLEAGPGDKVVAGGLLRGLAQYSLDAAVDLGVDGVALVPSGSFALWSDEPCVNCGTCLDVCPAGLRAHQIARFAEFGLFDRTEALGLERCIECGLCAVVCPSRRPMLQRIRLAKRELAEAAEAEAKLLGGPPRAPAREPDPIPVSVATAAKD